MRDLDVRAALHAQVLAVHRGAPDTLVVDELGLQWGAVRIDIAVINGIIHGWEIKSDADTLERLPAQASVYSRVLDRVTLVAGTRHLRHATDLVPDWWELREVQEVRGGLAFRTVRPGSENPRVDPEAVASLLWRDEALAMLEDVGAAAGFRSKPRKALYRQLASVFTADQIRSRVRATLRQRSSWRSAG